MQKLLDFEVLEIIDDAAFRDRFARQLLGGVYIVWILKFNEWYRQWWPGYFW